MSHRACIGLGSNIQPERHLPAAVVELARIGELARVSQVYGSAAVGDVEQPAFLNAAVLLVTDHSPQSLCTLLREIETNLGRVRDPDNRNAARTIDLDLVLYDESVLTIGHRRIPDPDLLDRSFVAVPMADIDPHFVHPQTGETLSFIADRLRATGAPLHQRSDIQLFPVDHRQN